MSVTQSNDKFLLNGLFDIQVTITKIIQGSGNPKNPKPPRVNALKKAAKNPSLKLKAKVKKYKLIVYYIKHDLLYTFR